MLNFADVHRVHAQLKQFGSSQTEASTYLQLLQMGPSSVIDIAKKLNTNRLTVHSAIQQLIKKGLLYETRKGKKRLIAAEEPEVLRRILQTKYEELKVTETNLDYIIKLLHSVESSNKSVPSVRFYEEIDGFKRMLEETLEAQGEVLVFSYVDLLAKLVGTEYLENYFERRAKKGIRTRLIFPPCEFANRVYKKADRYKIEVRLLSAELQWHSGIFIWNDNIALLSYTQSKLTCTIVKNEDIADFFKRINFELIWCQAKPMLNYWQRSKN